MSGPGVAIAEAHRRHPAPMRTLAVALIVFGILAGVRGDTRYWSFLVVVCVVAAIVAAVERRTHFTRALVWMLVSLGVLHLAGGLLPPPSGATFYETWLIPGVVKFDQAVHFYGSAVATLAAWQVLGRFVDPLRMPVRTQATVAGALALGKGALNEVVEFVLAANVAGARIGTAANTQWDLVFNLAGVLATISFLRWGAVDRHLIFRQAQSPIMRRTIIGRFGSSS